MSDSGDKSRSAAADRDDSDYFIVSSDVLHEGAKSLFDLYVRLPSGKFIKVLNAGDSFTEQRIRGYADKGVTTFHARREDQERYLAHREQALAGTLSNPAAPVERKVTETIRYGEETIRYLRSAGLSEPQLQRARGFVEQVTQLVSGKDTQKNALFKAFFSNLAACEHGAGTAIVASMLSPQLKLPKDASVTIVGIAAFFHDIGLLRLPPELQHEDEARMTEEQKALFRTHPAVGAQVLRATRLFQPAAIEAVSQHHDRLVQGQGFSSSIGALTDVAEVVGISDEFVRLIQRKKEHPKLNPLEEMERRVFEGFSRPVADAFRKAFFLTLL